MTAHQPVGVQQPALDLNAVVRDVESMLRRVMGDQVFLDTQLEPVLPAIWGDRGQIEQILMNLVVNARDAIDAGGTVRIRTSAATDGDAPPAAEAGVDYVLLEVIDDGSGMAPELIERIFDPFFTTKEPGKGTGLGLSTVYGIVQQSGGQIDVQSEPGSGTRFRIWLRRPPASAVGRSEADRDGMRRPASQRKVTVLSVEDEPAVRAVAARVLERAGHRVHQAGSGDEGLRLAEVTTPDVVLSDVVMAGMTGPEMVRRMRDRRPELPVIFMSGYAEEHIPDGEALRLGEHFLAKPFSPDALLQAVERIVTRGDGA